MSRQGLYIGTAIVVAAAVIFWLVPWGAQETGEPDGLDSSAASEGTFTPPPSREVPVDVATAEMGDLVMRITAMGTAEADRLLEVASRVDGRIKDIPVAEGAFVEVDELLVLIDDTELKMARDQAEAALLQSVMRFAENMMAIPGDPIIRDSDLNQDSGMSAAEFLRQFISPQGYQALLAHPTLEARLEALSREEISSAHSELASRTVSLEVAELELQRARVLAPFAGQVTGLDAVSGPNFKSWPVVGQQIGPGVDLMLLVDADPISLRVEVIESEIGQVHEGRSAEVRFPAFPDRVFSGTITRISPVVDASRKSLAVSVALPNPEHRLKPGMSAQVILDTEIFTDRLLVPATAVIFRDDRPVVFVVRNDRAQWEYIEKGLENAEWIEVLSGVAAGDVVITSGHFTMAHDTPVRFTEPS
jgi:RND family efflux transporter MFP subunit